MEGIIEDMLLADDLLLKEIEIEESFDCVFDSNELDLITIPDPVISSTDLTTTPKSSSNISKKKEKQIKQPNLQLQKQQRRKAQLAKAAKKFRTRKKENMISLRERVKVLQEELKQLREKHSMSESKENFKLTSSQWEEEALIQRQKVGNSKQENFKLRQALKQQIQLNEMIQRALAHSSMQNNVSMYLGEQWRAYRLSKEPQQRRWEMNAILERQLDRLSSQLIQYQLRETEQKDFTNDQVKEGVAAIVRQNIYSTSDTKKVADIWWKFLTGGIFERHSQCFGMKCVEVVDENTKYMELVEEDYHCRTLVRRWNQNGNWIFSWRSILEDSLLNFDSSESKVIEEGWIVLNPVSNGTCQKILENYYIDENMELCKGFLHHYSLISNMRHAFLKFATSSTNEPSKSWTTDLEESFLKLHVG